MNNTILPYGLFLFIALFIYYGAYAIPYEKKHKPPEETSRWIFWVDVVLVKGILVILIIAYDNFKQIDFASLAWRCVSLSTKPPAKKYPDRER